MLEIEIQSYLLLQIRKTKFDSLLEITITELGILKNYLPEKRFVKFVIDVGYPNLNSTAIIFVLVSLL